MIGGTYSSQPLYPEHRRVSDLGDSYHVANEKGDKSLSMITTTITSLSTPSPSTSRSSSSLSSAQSPSRSNLPCTELNGICDEDQYPAPHIFDSIVQDYLQKLSIKKRDKALVNQKRYALILQVLKDPRNTSVGTAQFRFWVRKMFQLSTTGIMDGRRQNQPSSTLVEVCHDGKPVAMQEQIYDILIQAHRIARHGGRDKTSALVRKRFSCIPKELTVRFIQHCPFCTSRRNRHHGSTSLNQQKLAPTRLTTAPKTSDSTFIKERIYQTSTANNISEDGYSHHHRSSHLDYYGNLSTTLPLTPGWVNYSWPRYQHDKPIIAPLTPTDVSSATTSAVSTQWREPGVPVYYYGKSPSHDTFSSAAMDLHPYDASSSTGSHVYSSFFVDQQISPSQQQQQQQQQQYNNSTIIVSPTSTVDSINSLYQQEAIPSPSPSPSPWGIMAPPTASTE